jgi:hypothetical protein
MERKARHIAESTTLQSTARTAKIFPPKINQLKRSREWDLPVGISTLQRTVRWVGAPHCPMLGLQRATQLATIGHLRLTNSRYTRAVQSRTSKAANKSTAMRIA